MMINMGRLKTFALERLPPDSTLRDVLLAEREELTAEEFLAKLDVWLLLFKKEIGG